MVQALLGDGDGLAGPGKRFCGSTDTLAWIEQTVLLLRLDAAVQALAVAGGAEPGLAPLTHPVPTGVRPSKASARLLTRRLMPVNRSAAASCR